jgi:hypothetical protein
LYDPLRLLAEASQGNASAYGCRREPLPQVMLVRDLNGRLGPAERA